MAEEKRTSFGDGLETVGVSEVGQINVEVVQLNVEVDEHNAKRRLVLGVDGQQEWIGTGRNLILLGRNPSNDIVIDNDYVSRTHARLEYREDRFYLRDESQNGTYVFFQSQSEPLLVRRREIELDQPGVICLGQRLEQALSKDVIKYHFDSKVNSVSESLRSVSPELSLEETAIMPGLSRLTSRRVLENHLVCRLLEEYIDRVLVLLSKDGFILYYNQLLEQLTRRSYAEFVGQDFFSFIHPDDRQELLDILTQVGLGNCGSSVMQVTARLCTAVPRWQSYVFNVTLTSPSMQALGLDGIVLIGQVQQQVLDKNLLAHRYRIIRSLSNSNFCHTYLGEDCQRPANPRCIIKQLHLMHPDPKVLQVSRRLFHQEALTLETLGRHDRIPLLLAYLEDNDYFFLIQDYIEGSTLDTLFTRPWSLLETVDLVRQVLYILLYVHRQGVIHRDIKPANIIRRSFDNNYALIDFGSVKLLPSSIWAQTHQGGVKSGRPLTIVVGTPGYMAPEQGFGKPSKSSDIYSLGVVAIEALLGVPYERVRQDWVNRLRELSIDSDFISILQRMVSPLEERYQEVSDVLIELNYLSLMAVDLNRDIV